VFCRFMSSGNSYKDCGHPCEQHKVHLRDEKGDDHLVLADMGTCTRVFTFVWCAAQTLLVGLLVVGFGDVWVLARSAGMVGMVLRCGCYTMQIKNGVEA